MKISAFASFIFYTRFEDKIGFTSLYFIKHHLHQFGQFTGTSNRTNDVYVTYVLE